jgi:hypothetical protein
VFRDHLGVATFHEAVLRSAQHNVPSVYHTLRVVRVRADSSVEPGDAMQKHMLKDNSAFNHYAQNCLYRKDFNPT